MLLKRIVILLAALSPLLSTGCAIPTLIGGMAQVEEYQKLVDTPPKYAGLEGKTVAVLVQADYSTMFEHADVVANITGGVAGRIATKLENKQVLDARHVINWQYRTPQWAALPFGEMCAQLNVDRIVFIDLLEYRLNPPGNRYLWEGTCVARVGIIERDGIDPDMFVETFDLSVKYPHESGITRDSASADTINYGLQYNFVEKTTWLFYQHLEPKYPDKYRPELDTKQQREGKR
jgi:hypothetical protein